MEAEPRQRWHRKPHYIAEARHCCAPKGHFPLQTHHKRFPLAEKVDYISLLNNTLYKKEYSCTGVFFFFLFFIKNAAKPRQQTKENARVNKAEGRHFVEHIKVVSN